MTSTLNLPGEDRFYGDWGRPPQAGITRSLGPLGTGLLIGGTAVAALVMLVTRSLLATAAVAGVVGVLLTLLSIRDRHHRNGMQRASTWIGGWRTRRRKAHVLAQGPLGQVGYGEHRLPGLAAASELTDWPYAYGRFCLLHVPGDNSYALTMATDPDGASLVDREVIDQRVAQYGQWLTGLGAEQGLVGAAVTVETARDFGTRLQREVETNTDPDSHPVAQAHLAEAVQTYPEASWVVRDYVALTFSGTSRAGRRQDREDVGRDLATRMPGLVSSLAGTGAGAVRPLAATDLCEAVHVAYDPSSARAFEAARAARQPIEMAWTEAGPAYAEEGYDTYRHDSGLSATYVMSAPPAGEVPETILARVLAPIPDADRKRVSILYRPFDPATTARTVRNDLRNARNRKRSSKVEDERAEAEYEAAKRTARAEARGHGLVNFAIVVTVTVTDPARLPDARAAVENLAAAARLTIRPVYNGQATAFAAGLPIGLVTARHMRVPAELRAAM